MSGIVCKEMRLDTVQVKKLIPWPGLGTRFLPFFTIIHPIMRWSVDFFLMMDYLYLLLDFRIYNHRDFLKSNVLRYVRLTLTLENVFFCCLCVQHHVVLVIFRSLKLKTETIKPFQEGRMMRIYVLNLNLGFQRIKNETSEFYTCCGCETKTRVVRIFIIFQHRPMFSHINGKLSPGLFEWYGWT